MTESQPEIVVTADRIATEELKRLVEASFGNMVKVVVDLRRRVVAIGGQLHADAEALLLDDGSLQPDLWGANYYPGLGPDRCLEYTALINIRPADGNPAMTIADPAIREQVRTLVHEMVGTGAPL